MREREGFNIVQRLFDRQIFGSPPGSTIPQNRRLFEVIVPTTQVKLSAAPDAHICKFLPSGELVCFGSMQHEVLVYRYSGLSHCGPDTPESLPFSSFFQLKFGRVIVQGDDMLCKELCLVTPNGRFLLLASCTATGGAQQPDESPVQGVPFVPSTTFHLVETETGEVRSRYSILNDFVHVAHANGVFLLEDMVCILAVRSQTIHILHITESGKLVLTQRLGTHCRDDDELALARYFDAEFNWRHSNPAVPAAARAISRRSEDAVAEGSSSEAAEAEEAQPSQQIQPRARLSMNRAVSAPLLREPVWSHMLRPSAAQRQRTAAIAGAAARVGALMPARGENPRPAPRQAGRGGMIEGIRQRLMAYLYLQCNCSQRSPDARKRFFYHFEDYAHLAMWKVQMLDKEHLLISMGLPDAGMTRESGSLVAQSFCLVVWSIPEARVVDLHDAASIAMVRLYQSHWQHFHIGCQLSPWHRFLTASAGCRMRITPQTPAVAVRRVLSNIPATCQALSPSPYLDSAIYSYDEKLISALMRPRPPAEAPLRFAPRRTGRLRFKLALPPGEPPPAAQGRSLRHLVAHHFHPSLPVVLCVSQSFVLPSQLTIFFQA